MINRGLIRSRQGASATSRRPYVTRVEGPRLASIQKTLPPGAVGKGKYIGIRIRPQRERRLGGWPSYGGEGNLSYHPSSPFPGRISTRGSARDSWNTENSSRIHRDPQNRLTTPFPNPLCPHDRTNRGAYKYARRAFFRIIGARFWCRLERERRKNGARSKLVARLANGRGDRIREMNLMDERSLVSELPYGAVPLRDDQTNGSFSFFLRFLGIANQITFDLCAPSVMRSLTVTPSILGAKIMKLTWFFRGMMGKYFLQTDMVFMGKCYDWKEP